MITWFRLAIAKDDGGQALAPEAEPARLPRMSARRLAAESLRLAAESLRLAAEALRLAAEALRLAMGIPLSPPGFFSSVSSFSASSRCNPVSRRRRRGATLHPWPDYELKPSKTGGCFSESNRRPR
jgi:hypothetical protein